MQKGIQFCSAFLGCYWNKEKHVVVDVHHEIIQSNYVILASALFLKAKPCSWALTTQKCYRVFCLRSTHSGNVWPNGWPRAKLDNDARFATQSWKCELMRLFQATCLVPTGACGDQSATADVDRIMMDHVFFRAHLCLEACGERRLCRYHANAIRKNDWEEQGR